MKLLTKAEVEAIMRISRRTLQRMLERRELRGVRVGGQVRIYEESVGEYLARNEIGAETSAKAHRLEGWGG